MIDLKALAEARTDRMVSRHHPHPDEDVPYEVPTLIVGDPADTFLSAVDALLEADQTWRCVKHGCDIPTDIPGYEPDYCQIEGEWGDLDPANCQIEFGVWVPVKGDTDE